MSDSDDTLSKFRASENIIDVYFSGQELFVYAKYDEFSDDEIELVNDSDYQWKIARIAYRTFLCFCPNGYSWNEVELNTGDKSRNIQALLDYHFPSLPIVFTAIYKLSGEIIMQRSFTLDPSKTEKLLNALAAQREVNYKKITDLDSLGDPNDLIKALQSSSENINITDIEIDKEEYKTVIKTNMMPKREPNEPRPRWILRHFENISKELVQTATELVEAAASVPSDEQEWKNCLISSEVFDSINRIKTEKELRRQLGSMGMAHLVPEYLQKLNVAGADYPNIFAALMYNWRYSKGIYDFDSEFLKTIYLASLPLNADPELLTRLPEYAVYVKTPGMTDWKNRTLQGFFAMCETTIEEFISEEEEEAESVEFSYLYILLDIAQTDASTEGLPELLRMPLNEGTLDDCLDWLEIVDPRSDEQPESELLVNWFAPFLNQLLYLCSEEPEIDKGRGDKNVPGTETVKKTRKGNRLFAPTIVNEWLCGWRTGRFLKEQKEREQSAGSSDGTKTVRSHLRRAHWHTFYSGKRDAEQRDVKIKWLPMIKVNFEGSDTSHLPAVIKKINEY